MRIIVVVGARPNFVKVAPLLPALAASGHTLDLAFTGSRTASRGNEPAEGLSFHGVKVQAPRWFLDVGEDTDAVETGRALVALERLLEEATPDAVMAVGDVNATLATAIAAAKLAVPVIHLEAGLRCGDMTCPGEINRVLISRITSLHLAPTENAVVNLLGEGVSEERIQFVGSSMAESVLLNLDAIKKSSPALEYGMMPDGYVLASFHSPENLMVPERVAAIGNALTRLGLPVLVPDARDLCDGIIAAGGVVPPDLYCLDPVPYLDMLALQRDAVAVITDSGGIQEEACMLGTPCVTVRDSTEHDATIEVGANQLTSASSDAIVDAVGNARAGSRNWVAPKRWDRAVSDRIVRALKRGVTPLS